MSVDQAFLVIASALGFLGMALGAFGSHALRKRLSAERLSQFDIGVRYQLWHALALFAVVLVRSLRLPPSGGCLGTCRSSHGRSNSGRRSLAGSSSPESSYSPAASTRWH